MHAVELNWRYYRRLTSFQTEVVDSMSKMALKLLDFLKTAFNSVEWSIPIVN